MKIVMVSPGHPEFDSPPRLGGIQQRIRGIARAFADSGNEVHLVYRGGGSRPSRVDGVHLHSVGIPVDSDVLSVLLYSRRVVTILRRLKPDIFSLHERFSAFFPSRLAMPKVFFAHNYDAMRFYAPFSRSYRRLNWGFFPLKNWMEEECMRRSNLVFALNRRDADYLAGRRIGQVLQIPNAVDPTEYRSGTDENYMLFAGRLETVKGTDVLAPAFEQVAGQCELDLHIAGDGPLRGELDRWRTESGLADRVDILGWLRPEKLRRELAHCSFLVLPSRYETFGTVLLEAMASRKPVIASRIPGPDEIVDASGAGLLVKPGDKEALARGCLQLAENPNLRRRLGRAGRRAVENGYSYEALAERLLSIYQGILT